MSPYATVWTEPFRIRAYEAGPDGLASVLSVCDLFQEAAGEQARAHDLELFPTAGGVATWVLNRLRVVVAGALPQARDAVTVDTWPSDRDNVRAHRDFVLRDAEGEAIVRATSVWFLIDTARRRPVRLPPAMDTFLPPPDVPRALTLDGAEAPSAPESADRTERFLVRYADVDRVGHANHVRVLEWLLEAVPEATRAARTLATLDVSFQTEATPGQTVISTCGGGAGRLNHLITREDDGRTVALAHSIWT